MKHLEILALLSMAACVAAASAAEPGYRYSAPLTVQQNAAFVQLPLPASAYARSLQAGLADLRIVDAQGARVPHALLPAREGLEQREERLRDAPFYPLPRPAAGAAGATLDSPVEVLVQGDRISVRRKGRGGPWPDSSDAPGWLVDLGERRAGEPAPEVLRLAWSSTADFSAGYELDLSDSLRSWRPAGGGQLLSLNSAQGPLVQRDVPLPPDVPRFVRIVWREPATAPQLSGVQAVHTRTATQAQDLPTEVRVQAKAVGSELHFDLGGPLPIVALDLALPAGTRVAPVRLQGRLRETDAWQPLGATVFYRIDREGLASRSPLFTLHATTRHVRVLPDERSGPLDAAQTQLVVQAQLARLVFAAQGQPPYTLQAGSADAPAGALPVATLVPQLDAERARFGRAELGAWTEVAAVAQAASAAERQAALRPVLLWAVLLAGVAGLGFMVWRLARGKPG